MIEYLLKDENTKAEGRLVYNNDPDSIPVEYTILSADEELIKKVNSYLNKKRKFWIPESNKIDDYRRDEAKPVSHLMYFEIALTELSSEVEVDYFEG
jgi:hypothetical protein